jgi:uncharacterized protein (UPF0332 family)
MTQDEARTALITLWLEKSEQAMTSAELELNAGLTFSALNRLYYACFYATTALLLKDGRQFASHGGVKAEFNRLYVKTGRIDRKWSKFYQKLFTDRQRGDYIATASFEAVDVAARLEEGREFVRVVRALIHGQRPEEQQNV